MQPDASAEVIRSNYRTLLQKLKLHPDLGGDNWNASLLNNAYNTLRHPAKREAYDRKLLKQYKLEQLSRGHLRKDTPDSIYESPGQQGNQRNYYRILHIQPDSPAAIVESSYRTLKQKKSPSLASRLVDDAFAVIGNPLKRALYDRLLQQGSHFAAVDRIKQTFKQNDTNTVACNKPAIITDDHAQKNAKTQPGSVQKAHAFSQTYAPVITHYCAFCKTPHQHSDDQLSEASCVECDSPLASPANGLTDSARRDVTRFNQSGSLEVWLDWPQSAVIATLIDLSPTGLKLELDQEPMQGQMIKVDADEFKAVGEISHVATVGSAWQVGLRFVAIRFQKQRGQFVRTSI